MRLSSLIYEPSTFKAKGCGGCHRIIFIMGRNVGISTKLTLSLYQWVQRNGSLLSPGEELVNLMRYWNHSNDYLFRVLQKSCGEAWRHQGLKIQTTVI